MKFAMVVLLLLLVVPPAAVSGDSATLDQYFIHTVPPGNVRQLRQE